MWLIAETVDSIRLEYWDGKPFAMECKLSLLTKTDNAADLDQVKELLNKLEAKPDV